MEEKAKYNRIYESNKLAYSLMNRMVNLFEDYMMDTGYDVFTLFGSMDINKSNNLDT